MRKPLSIGYGELEHVLCLLENNATPHTQADFEATLEWIAKEPRDILKKNRHLSPPEVEQIDQIKTLKAAYEWRECYGRLTVRSKLGGGYDPFLSELEKAAADLLVRLCYLSDIPAECLAATWEQESPVFKDALLLFLHHRDAGEAEGAREARDARSRAGRLQAKRLNAARSVKIAERNRRIWDRAAYLLRTTQYEHHELAGILAPKFDLSKRQVRRILQKKTGHTGS